MGTKNCAKYLADCVFRAVTMMVVELYHMVAGYENLHSAQGG